MLPHRSPDSNMIVPPNRRPPVLWVRLPDDSSDGYKAHFFTTYIRKRSERDIAGSLACPGRSRTIRCSTWLDEGEFTEIVLWNATNVFIGWHSHLHPERRDFIHRLCHWELENWVELPADRFVAYGEFTVGMFTTLLSSKTHTSCSSYHEDEEAFSFPADWVLRLFWRLPHPLACCWKCYVYPSDDGTPSLCACIIISHS